MNDKPESVKMEIIQRAMESTRRKVEAGPLPPGVTIHTVERVQTFGEPRRLEGDLIVELPDKSLHRITGSEVSEWNKALSPFLKNWRLAED